MKTIEYFKNGANIVEVVMEEEDFASKQLVEQRLSTCNACEHISADKTSCAHCSCLLEARTMYAESFCPIGKW